MDISKDNTSYPYYIENKKNDGSLSLAFSINDINNMNVILYDNDCGNTFFQAVVEKLRNDGINLTVAKTNDDINCNRATIIALDEQYSSGPETIIFAPYNNTRVGFSDSLAIAMYLGFVQNGIQVKQIECGQRGSINGNGLAVGPTNTEKSISDGCNSSFVTISLGTEKHEPNDVAVSIENGLIRQLIYLNSDDHQTDLIYRANSKDELANVAEYFGTTSDCLKKYNKMKSNSFNQSQTVINPYVEQMPAFSLEYIFNFNTNNS